MYTEINIRLTPAEARDNRTMTAHAARVLEVDPGRIVRVDVLRESIDARQRQVMIQQRVGVHVDREEQRERAFEPAYRDVASAPPVIVVGAGPAGLFAALRLIERGWHPIVLERGKRVEDRKQDLARLYRTGLVDEDSNYGFGEGGAGTFSDGKLFTRSTKRGNVSRVLEILVHHGASPQILVDAHPHIGTDKLPAVIVNMRRAIERYGGEVHFGRRVTGLLLAETGHVAGVKVGSEEIRAEHVILATGHSARDVYRMLHRQGVALQPKDFAAGLRVEHPQALIDRLQYHGSRGDFLPPAEYNFVTNVDGRGVYSFCMCPGGVIVPAATGPGQQVVNGMSASGRNTRWANSAIVTTIDTDDLAAMGYSGLFAGIEFQESLEHLAWEQGGRSLRAPAQRLTDFLADRPSRNFPSCSYKPGVTPTLFSAWLPPLLYRRLSLGLRQFGRRSRGFLTPEAVLLGVETRTSSPLRLPRDTDTMMHLQIKGLYPCGEGAGYAGGIISAAMDGEKCANAVH